MATKKQIEALGKAIGFLSVVDSEGVIKLLSKYNQTPTELSYEALNTAIVKAIGETPDTLTDAQALELGIISRDTAYVLAKETVFDEAYKSSRNESFPLDLATLTLVPHTTETYTVDAGMVEKGKVAVQVFEISTSYGAVFTALDAENKSYELDALLKVGSMDEASLNGNWGE